LDYPGGRQLLQQIIHLHETGHTIIVVTHELEKVIAHVNRLVVIQNGRIVRCGEPADLMGEVEIYGIREPCTSRYGQGLRSWLT
ncbi:MAG: ABC transporter ATP-binding protein, partial [bacterium]